MGLDMSYQAIPHDCRLLEMVVGKPNVGFNLAFKRFNDISDEDLERYVDDADFLEYAAEAQKVRRAHPGIENRYLDFGRRWGMLFYLLSEKRRDTHTPYDENDDWARRAIHGGKILGAEICLPQGVPIRYLPPIEVKEIAKAFGQISADEIAIYWNPPQMWEAGVYKIRRDDNESELIWLTQDFEKLKHFYLLAANYDEGVLTFCD